LHPYNNIIIWPYGLVIMGKYGEFIVKCINNITNRDALIGYYLSRCIVAFSGNDNKHLEIENICRCKMCVNSCGDLYL